MDLNEVAYVDKIREKDRQKKLVVYKETGEWPGLEKRKKESLAWSKNQEVLDKRRDKKMRKLEKRKAPEVVAEESEEEDDFQEDYKMMKKLKKGKISQNDFDEARCSSFFPFLGGALSLSFSLGSEAEIILFMVANLLVFFALPMLPKYLYIS